MGECCGRVLVDAAAAASGCASAMLCSALAGDPCAPGGGADA